LSPVCRLQGAKISRNALINLLQARLTGDADKGSPPLCGGQSV
jgi:hypothetical protein